MTESDPAAGLEHDADELEHRLDKLDDHLSEAEKAAEERREDLDPEIDATPGDGDGGDD
jgi:SMC interacting uncharacterized protein involved in chromosome segregation